MFLPWTAHISEVKAFTNSIQTQFLTVLTVKINDQVKFVGGLRITRFLSRQSFRLKSSFFYSFWSNLENNNITRCHAQSMLRCSCDKCGQTKTHTPRHEQNHRCLLRRVTTSCWYICGRLRWKVKLWTHLGKSSETVHLVVSSPSLSEMSLTGLIGNVTLCCSSIIVWWKH